MRETGSRTEERVQNQVRGEVQDGAPSFREIIKFGGMTSILHISSKSQNVGSTKKSHTWYLQRVPSSM
jgi:hypothetical protein